MFDVFCPPAFFLSVNTCMHVADGHVDMGVQICRSLNCTWTSNYFHWEENNSRNVHVYSQFMLFSDTMFVTVKYVFLFMFQLCQMHSYLPQFPAQAELVTVSVQVQWPVKLAGTVRAGDVGGNTRWETVWGAGMCGKIRLGPCCCNFNVQVQGHIKSRLDFNIIYEVSEEWKN